MAKLQGFTPTQIVGRLGKMKGRRANHENIWQQVNDYISPMLGDVIGSSSSGTPKYNDIFDSTAPTALELLAGTLHSMLTSPTSYFFGFSTGNPELDSRDSVRMWIQGTVRKMHDRLNQSNFQTEVHTMYTTILATGNAVQMMEDDPDTLVRFSTRPVKEGYFEENSKGMVDVLLRSFQLDARGLVEDFGEDVLPEKVLKDFKAGSPTKYEVIHSIYPMKSLPKEKRPKSNFKFISQYVLASEKADLEIKGFYEFPCMVPRWTKIPGEDYGRGCGEKALPETKTANMMTEITLAGAQKTIDPPLQMPDNGFALPLVTIPAGINYYRAGSQDRVEPIFNDARIDFGAEMIDRTQAKIREAFYIDQLKLRDGPQMTATETNERVEQALRFMGPMLGRLNVEYLDPMVTRLYGMMDRRGEIDPVPAELNGVPLKIVFTSIMAMSQRMSELTNIQRTLQSIAPIASADPRVLQNLHPDRSFKYIARLCQFPQEMVTTEEELAQMRQAAVDQANAAQENASTQADVQNASTLVNAAAKFGQSA